MLTETLYLLNDQHHLRAVIETREELDANVLGAKYYQHEKTLNGCFKYSEED